MADTDGAKNQELINALHDISGRMDKINHRLEDAEGQSQLTANAVEELRPRIITKEHLRHRRNQVIMWALGFCLVFVAIEHGMTTKCFLAPTQTGWPKTACAALYPGYTKAINQSHENLAKFQQLIGQVPVNEARITALETQVHALQDRQHQQ